MANSITATAVDKSRPQNLRCKVGDYAIVMKCKGVPGAIGRIVRVTEPATQSGYDWGVELQGNPLLVSSMTSTLGVTVTAELNIRDNCLAPLSATEVSHG